MDILETNKIAVFPSSKRDTQQSRLITESRLASFVKNSIDSKGFVYSFDGKKIEFYLMGYYFICDIESILPSESSSLYVQISILNDSSESISTGLFDIIDVIDNDGSLSGVEFYDTAPDSSWNPIEDNSGTNNNYDTHIDDSVWYKEQQSQDNASTLYRLKLLDNIGTAETPNYVINDTHYRVKKSNNVVIVSNTDWDETVNGGTVTYHGQTEIINIDCGSLDL